MFRFDGVGFEPSARLKMMCDSDRGNGIDPSVLSGRAGEGHYGLHGMRERAQLIGAKLTIHSEVKVGTDVGLVVPAGSAYLSTRKLSWLARKSAAKAGSRDL